MANGPDGLNKHKVGLGLKLSVTASDYIVIKSWSHLLQHSNVIDTQQ